MTMKYCVDTDLVESSLALGLIEGVSTYECLDERKLLTFLKSKAVLSADVIDIDDISEIISREFRMDTTTRCVTSRT